jgi:hypothetical protein
VASRTPAKRKPGYGSVRTWGALGLVAVATSALAPATGGCTQPRVTCVTGRGDFAAKYTLVSGSGPCAMLHGDTIGVQSYNAMGDDHPKLEDTSVGLRAASLGALVQHAEDQGVADANAAHKPYAFGRFDSAEPAGDDFCTVPALSAAEQDLPLVPAVPPDPNTPGDMGTPEQPATHVKYEWSHVRVLVTPAATGTQFAADLTYTQDGCVATYRVAAVYPSVACADANGQPDNSLCAAEPDPAAGRAVGSGISPDFPVVCDPDLHQCVLTKEPPALR